MSKLNAPIERISLADHVRDIVLANLPDDRFKEAMAGFEEPAEGEPIRKFRGTPKEKPPRRNPSVMNKSNRSDYMKLYMKKYREEGKDYQKIPERVKEWRKEKRQEKSKSK